MGDLSNARGLGGEPSKELLGARGDVLAREGHRLRPRPREQLEPPIARGDDAPLRIVKEGQHLASGAEVVEGLLEDTRVLLPHEPCATQAA